MAWDNRKRERWAWLRSSIADVAGSGGTLDAADVAALPEAHRSTVRAIAKHAAELHNQGAQAAALEYARDATLQLEENIGPAWRPPAFEPPSAELLDRAQWKVI